MVARAGELGLAHHAVDLLAHADEGVVDPLALGLDVVGDRVLDDDARLVEDRYAARQPVDELEPDEAHLVARLRAHPGDRHVVDEAGARDQLRQHHRGGLERLDLDVLIVARLGVLDAEHAHRRLPPDDRHAREAVEQLLAGLRAVDERRVRLGFGEVERRARRGDGADEALPQRELGDVDGFLREALGGEQLEHAVAQQVDRADLGVERLRDDRDDAVELRLGTGLRRHDVVEPAQNLARGDGGAGRRRAHSRRSASAAAASPTRPSMIAAAGSSRVTMPTDWPAMSEPCSTSPSTTARRSAPAQ